MQECGRYVVDEPQDLDSTLSLASRVNKLTNYMEFYNLQRLEIASQSSYHICHGRLSIFSYSDRVTIK